MIYYVSGPVTVLEPGLAVVDCAGVGSGCHVTGYTAAKSSDTNRYAAWYNNLLANGVYAAPSQFEAMFLSAAHTDADLDQLLERIAAAAKAL